MTVQHEVSMNGLNRQARAAVTLARLTGWTMFANRKQTMITLFDPTHTHKVVVPYGSINASRADSILRQIARHTPPGALVKILADRHDMRDDPDAASVVALLGPSVVNAVLDTVETWDEIPASVHGMIPANHAVRRLPGGPDYQRPREPEPEVETTDGDYIEAPYQGRVGDGVEAFVWVYPGGRTEYVCKSHPEPQVFRSVNALNGHGRLHGTDRTKPAPQRWVQPTGTHVCPECERTFTRTTGLGAHRWRAHGVKGGSASAERYRSGRETQQVAGTESVAESESMTGRQIAVRVHGTEMARVPWAARRGSGGHAGSGVMYESQIVDQVTYADGHVGYICKGCEEYASDHAMSVARHGGATHPGLATRDEVVQFRVPDYEPSGQKRHHNPRLQHVITEALDAIEAWQAMTADELAQAISDFMMENKPDVAPAEPLTDAEILTRIVRLVDRGQYAQLQQAVDSLSGQVRDLSETIDGQGNVVRELEGDRDQALARVQSLVAERTALREMLEPLP